MLGHNCIVVSGLNMVQEWNSHILCGSLGYRPVVGTYGDIFTLWLYLHFLSACSGWSPGSHLGHPANASCHWGPNPGLHSRGRDQQCTVGIHPARLDSHLLQQLPGDPQSLTLLLHAQWGRAASFPVPSKVRTPPVKWPVSVVALHLLLQETVTRIDGRGLLSLKTLKCRDVLSLLDLLGSGFLVKFFFPQ